MEKKNKILITGGSGFIGNKLLENLNNSSTKVLALSRKNKGTKNNITWIKSDLKLNEKNFKLIKNFEPNIVIHLAWEKIPDFSKEMCNKNFYKTKLFFKKILKINSIKKIIVSGSCFEYYNKSGKKKETNKTNLKDNFPKTKNKVYNFLKKNCKKDLSLAWFRIFFAYGLGQREDSLIPYLFKSLRNKKEVLIKTPLLSNDYIYVDDISNIIIKAINIKYKSGIYNLGSGKFTKTIDIVNYIEKIKGKKLNLILGNNNKEKIFFANMDKTIKTFQYKKFIGIKKGIRNLI